MLTFFKSKKAGELLLILLAAALVFVAFVLVQPSFAADSGFKKMGLVGRHLIAASPANVYTYQGEAGASANEMPDGFLMYTASGDQVYIRRNTVNLLTFETNSLKIPADEEVVITPFDPYKVSTTYFNSFEVVGTVGDTLVVIPMWR